ncbi:MAG: hypothetical protein GTO00_09195 [Deltaproteobacteria bacterium]|nr:hypothetical protein [Deltaproteobacteria bacterium]
MYVYIRSEGQLYTVGHYAPDGIFIPESDWSMRENAARRVNWLNGGTGNQFPENIRAYAQEVSGSVKGANKI